MARPDLPPLTTTTPGYDRSALQPRVLHIGFGAFARAFLAAYLDETLDAAGGDWGMVAVRLQSGADDLDALDAAGRVYTVAAADDEGIEARMIQALVGTRHPARDGIDALLGHFEHPALAIVSLTVTEKGYCSRAGRLDAEHAGIRQDLATPEVPATTIGVLVEGLRRRRAAGLGGVTVLSCDNLPDNGTVCRAVVTDYARRRDPALAEWIDAHVTFPCTMVDRIVPALDADAQALLRAIGADDATGIVCEPFRQWVIEDHFVAGRPDFALAGAEFVADVRPFEDMKLRMLNGSHSFLAYLGALAGVETIADCVADPAFRAAARGLMLKEQAPTLSMPDGIDLEAYAAALLKRFANSRLKHRTRQIATDGSQKLPQRMLASVRHHLRQGTPWPRLALGIAAWMAYCRGHDETGAELPLSDPLAEPIRAIAATTADGSAHVAAMLKLDSVFAPDIAGDAAFRSPVEAAYLSLRRDGVRASLAALGD
ncbi:mannitol dehydrogenase family protein [Polymorphum gilvum]|uniref:Mannitol dehydrogenase rossman domain family n=1 Tax=Polymorphum gilvum (strain LMG 25793 / CGMCC 1.9160 / SL003B-26A1) TaxID=991905 RepID=F2IXK2_POLGS|nr:mannitol dehydrogenase family protein [Polymorphum gilvum]ADZ71625.1 Mannitol dehydrogenase rossman domain family [Polymorphum gilvum SL003B-26A1]